MNYLYSIICLTFLVCGCENAQVNKSDAIVKNDKLMDLLNKGDTTSVQSQLANTIDDKEKLILASSLAMDAGVDIYELLPLLKAKLFDKPIANGLHKDSHGKLAKKLTKNAEATFKFSISQKQVEEVLAFIDQAIIEIEKTGEDKNSKDFERIKNALTLIEPNFSRVFELNKKNITEDLHKIQDQINTASTEYAESKNVIFEVKFGKLKNDAVNLMVGILSIIPIIELTPELKEDDFAKIDKAIKVLREVGVQNPGLTVKANKHIILLSAIAIINKVKVIYKLHGDYESLFCQDDENSLIKFIETSEKYFQEVKTASDKIGEINKDSSFVKLSKDIDRFTNKSKDEKNGVFESVNAFMTKEKSKYCD